MLSLVVGVGNAWCGDDGAGAEVARRLRATSGVDVAELAGDASALLELWAGRERVAVVDAACSGAAAGTLMSFRADAGPLPAALLRSSSTHAFGVADAIELARALGRLPAHLEVHAIEGEDFAPGRPPSPAVKRAAARLATRLVSQS
jgi:hydrogenase maturation protease